MGRTEGGREEKRKMKRERKGGGGKGDMEKKNFWHNITITTTITIRILLKIRPMDLQVMDNYCAHDLPLSHTPAQLASCITELCFKPAFVNMLAPQSTCL